MNKISVLVVVLIIVTVGTVYQYFRPTMEESSVVLEQKVLVDAKNITYVIEGKEFALINGRAEKEIVSDSVSIVTVEYFGNEVKADFNDDNKEDIAFLLTQSSGGSGTFYYFAAALNSGNGYNGTNTIFLGDRIAPQTTEFRNGEIIVNYAEREPNEPMTARPSVGVSRYFKISDNKLMEISK